MSYGKYTIKLRHKHNTSRIFYLFIGVLRYYNLSSVGQRSYYTTQHRSCHHTSSHLAGSCMVYVNSWRMMYMGRHRLAEELIRVIVAIVVSPAPVHIVRPTTVVMVLDTSLPTRNITSACYARGITLHQTTTAWNDMPVMLGLWCMRYTNMMHLPVRMRTLDIAVCLPALGMTLRTGFARTPVLHTGIGTTTTLSLGTCIETCH